MQRYHGVTGSYPAGTRANQLQVHPCFFGCYLSLFEMCSTSNIDFGYAGRIILFGGFMIETKRTKLLRETLQCILSIDRDILHRLKKYANTKHFLPNRDIALSLILEKAGKLEKYNFATHFSPHAIDQVLEDFEREYTPNVYEELSRLIYNLGEYSKLYEYLIQLERHVINKLGEKMITKYPKQLYYLRLNLLERYMRSLLTDKYLKYAEEDFPPEERVIYHFLQSALNEYYSDYKDYNPPRADYNKLEFEQFLEENEPKK